MFKKVLVPTDGSPLSEKAIAAAIEFTKTMGGTLVALSVAEPFVYSALVEGAGVIPMDSTEYDEKAQQLAQNNVDKVAAQAKSIGVACKTEVALSFNPYEEIVRVAKQSGCDVIFMASHGRKGLNKLFVGSETQKVLAHTTIPVLVFR